MSFDELQMTAREFYGRSVSPDPKTMAYEFPGAEEDVAFLARLRAAGVPCSFWSGAIAVSVSVLA